MQSLKGKNRRNVFPEDQQDLLNQTEMKRRVKIIDQPANFYQKENKLGSFKATLARRKARVDQRRLLLNL